MHPALPVFPVPWPPARQQALWTGRESKQHSQKKRCQGWAEPTAKALCDPANLLPLRTATSLT